MKNRIRLRTGQVAAQFNRTAAWLRQLEIDGVIPPAERDELNGERVYTAEDVERIRQALLNRKRMAEVVPA